MTEKVWDYANEFAIPAAIFINKMDRERADFEKTVADLQGTFSDKSLVVLQLPMGSEENFKGVVDLVAMKAYAFKGDASGAYDKVDIPAEFADQAAKYREKLVETAVEMNDEVMERYLNGDEIGRRRSMQCIKDGISNRKIVPIFCGSGLKNIGANLLLDAVVAILPRPPH